jgi:hypothetical protein
MQLYAVGLLVITALRILMAPLLAVAQPAGHVRRCGALRAGVTSTESKH